MAETIKQDTSSEMDEAFCGRIAFSFPRTPAGPAAKHPARELARVGEIRRICGAKLRAWGLERFTDSMQLLLSELVTNAIQHGSASQIGVRLSYTTREVRIETRSGPVSDLTAHTPGLLDEGGRGLLLIDAIADAWGVDNAGWVWCALATASAEEGRP
ncbi:ATP-binding protein (plasmid) [Streptomyces sp. R39]|uniref:ATP-binding protein n=1 Tax=Streptomyces sp. R39 TaxID=3238631 RepID=A0AB39R6V3_9ACTN